MEGLGQSSVVKRSRGGLRGGDGRGEGGEEGGGGGDGELHFDERLCVVLVGKTV